MDVELSIVRSAIDATLIDHGSMEAMILWWGESSRSSPRRSFLLRLFHIPCFAETKGDGQLVPGGSHPY